MDMYIDMDAEACCCLSRPASRDSTHCTQQHGGCVKREALRVELWNLRLASLDSPPTSGGDTIWVRPSWLWEQNGGGSGES